MDEELEGMDENEKNVLKGTAKWRCLLNREERERAYQDGLLDAYIRKYTALSKQMVLDYKRQAINAFLTGSYCEGAMKKNISKHKALIERVLYGEQGWHRLRVILQKKAHSDLAEINLTMPFSLRKAAGLLHDEFQKFMEVPDLDEATAHQIALILGYDPKYMVNEDGEDVDSSTVSIGEELDT